MKKPAFCFLLTLLLTACQSQSDSAPPVADARAVEGNAAAAATNPAPDAAYLIVPGERIGRVRLGMPAAEVYSIVGKADSGDAAMGKALSFWILHKMPREYLAVYTANNFDGTGSPPTVQQAQVTSPQFKTKGGIGAGTGIADIRQQFNQLQPLAYYLDSQKQHVYIYDARQRGIAFEITAADSVCTAITVYSLGTDITETYLPIHPDVTRLQPSHHSR